MDIAYWAAMTLMFAKVWRMASLEMLNLLAMVVIGSMWVVTLTPAFIVISGSTFHPRFLIASISGWYLFVLFVMVCSKNLSL